VIEFDAEGPSIAAAPERDPSDLHGLSVIRGTPKHGDLKIFIPTDVLAAMSDHADEDLRMELGGALAGDIYSWKGTPYAVVAGYIPAEEYENTAASFRFTHNSWEQIRRDLDRLYPDKLLVGWHHTHPGYGVFLSGADQFIQNNFFNLPHQFAVVTDPRSRTFGFFQNKDSKIEKLPGYFEIS
jgi:proteasome lid subunit RPN8/RPN11